ncbi:MAG: DUF975 family protein [Bacillota bacterium]|nr:DUF975 family protein [Bacillota bacterium]
MQYNSYNPKSRAELKDTAKEKLKGNWSNAILVCLVVFILTGGVSLTISGREFVMYGVNARNTYNFGDLIKLIIGGPMSLGMVYYFLNLLRDKEARIEDAFSGFRNFASAFLVQLLSEIFIILWALLLIIPGIIAALSYSMAYYILNDNPELSAMDVIRESKKLMDGEKARLFVLGLSFLGWIIVGVITLGIGFLWITPYMNATMAAFYEDLKRRKLVNNDIYKPDNYTENP